MKTKRVTFLFALFCMLSGYAIGQSITGEVKDAKTGEPVPGANVVAIGTTVGTVTDMDGKFSLSLPSGSKQIRVSFVGYKEKVVDVIPGGSYTVTIDVDDQMLNEIVVVGYGSQKKVNLTGAVASVDTKVLEARPIADVGRGLQGTTPGLTIVVPSGELGSDPIMKIRGQYTSIEGKGTPLILVDNVEIPSIQLLNPDDIESISILKDAASSSIYGSKAAFGVILITTKKGAKQESVNVSYSTSLSFQNVAKKMEMGRIDALDYTVEAMKRVNATSAGVFWQMTAEGFDKAKEWQKNWGGKIGKNDPYVYGRDWYVDANNRKIGLRTFDPYDYMIKEWTPTQTHNLSVNGRSGKTDYNVSLGYLDQEGIIQPSKHDDFRRYNGAVRVGADITKNLRIYGGTMYSKRVKRYAYATNSTTADPWLYIYRWGPTYPFGKEDGESLRSPAYELEAANTAMQETNYTSMNGGINYTPLKNWNINLEYTYADQGYNTKRPGTRFTARDTWSSAIPKLDKDGNRIYVNSNGEIVPSSAEGAMAAFRLASNTYTGIGSNPDHVYEYAKHDKWSTLNFTTSYDLSIEDSHKFKFMLGASRIGYEYTYNWSQVTQLVDYGNPQFDLAYGTQTSSGGAYWESQVGFFGRLNYNFREKYLLESNLRYDGSSKFPKDLKWRAFPSFSAGWRVTEENFMKWTEPVLSGMKLRASWGMIGDQSVDNALYIPTIKGSQNYWLIGGARSYQFATPDAVSESITWQDIATLDFGLDMQFLNNSLTATFDWYQRNTNNMIVPQEGIAGGFGTAAPKSNNGSLETKGYEIQLDYNHRFSNGLGINITATFDDAITKITKYGSTKSIDSWYVGKTYGEIWGYETDRLYQKEDFAYDNNGQLILVASKDIPTVKVNQLADPNAPTQAFLQNTTFIFGPGDVKLKDLNNDGVINDGTRLTNDHGDLKKIGNSTPRYNYSLRIGADYKGFDASVFLQGVGSRQIWGNGSLVIPGYNSSDGGMSQTIAGDFWKEDRTDAFYPRPYNYSLVAGADVTKLKGNMAVQSKYLLDMSYLRIKNITLGYTLPSAVSKKLRISKLRIYGALENFFTFDKLGDLPVDPEVISGVSMWRTDTDYNSNRTGVGVPTYKSASVGLQLNF